MWLDTEEAIDPEQLASSLDDLGYRILAIEDAHSELAEEQARPARVGLFGFLSVGFIAVAMLSVLALVIYSALSFRQRFIQLGILRAMGLSTSQLVFSLGGEQVMGYDSRHCCRRLPGTAKQLPFHSFLPNWVR